MAERIDACAASDIDEEDVIRFDHGSRAFAIYRNDNDDYFCTNGLCTHEDVHLADGMVVEIAADDANLVEFPRPARQ